MCNLQGVHGKSQGKFMLSYLYTLLKRTEIFPFFVLALQFGLHKFRLNVFNLQGVQHLIKFLHNIKRIK